MTKGKLSFEQTLSILTAHPSVFLSLSFLQGTCVLSTARRNLPQRLLSAELQGDETEKNERRRDRAMEGGRGVMYGDKRLNKTSISENTALLSSHAKCTLRIFFCSYFSVLDIFCINIFFFLQRILRKPLNCTVYHPCL